MVISGRTAGTPVGLEFAVNQYAVDQQDRAHVAMSDDGGFVVVDSANDRALRLDAEVEVDAALANR